MKEGKGMKLPVPGFVPVPGPEAMRMIAAVLFGVGACLACAGALVLYAGRNQAEKKTPAFAWVFLGVGVVLMIDHGVQLLF